MTAQTLAQKLLAAAAGRDAALPGEIITCKVALAMFHDSSGPRRLQPMLQDLDTGLWDRNKVVLVMDHYVPEADDESRRIVRIARDWAQEQRLPHVYDSVGICHVVLPEHGHIRPGMFCVGGDSHSPTGGAFGAYMFGVGSTEMLGVVSSGEIWMRVPETLMMCWHGRLAPGVMAKDMMLYLIGRYGMNGGRYQAVEFCGEAVGALSMRERMTLSNLSAEMGAQAGLIAPDAVTQAYLHDAGAALTDIAHWRSDTGAPAHWHEFDASTLAPQVAAPHSPANTAPVYDYPDTPVQVAYIGACTGAKLDDLRAAASVLRGRRVPPQVHLLVAPASQREQAASALVQLGLRAVIAPSYSGLYFRNAFNVGLLLLTCARAHEIAAGDSIELDLPGQCVRKVDGTVLPCEPVPDFLLDMVQAGGLLMQLKRRLADGSLPRHPMSAL
ncbi:aconitase/3-isopropylmalate dehydratase large subunit family protein [Bordetella holmesii]|uniref:Isopropylmalate/citramalate isomerase large subunit family protein n=2 Tax=Bordetella holmesii TaxID=35814 RepID=A0A158M7N0_9BORD|nr:aconitase/3-isopropylmalate dehydratase large subunit family protein [Bordetella holmesii]AIT25691.1 aconitase family protein [Bordetella holmesii 44057]EWM43781.1 aconitase family protein [Bordetella holmesii 41130]EWM46259.1 aconitase family protein [Bordetella holmesii 35009]EWM50415.1 aconitase family protein [Bordetella holmesii 70147]AMD44834.1 3-isopropylmalate dehydratase [Bordetella holmesii H558]